MMSADDEPQLQTSKSQNSLVNEAFNLNSNFANIQPLTVLPPTTNHFKPISHSRTPSTEIKNLNLTALKPPPANMFANTTSKTPNSFFDQPTITPTLLAPPLTTNSVQPTPDQSKPPSNPSSSSNQSPVPSSLPPTNNIPLSTVTPPTGIPPPPSSSSAMGSSNPYAAKGALNKKVQHNVINVAPLTQPATFLSSPTSTMSQQSGPILLPPAPESTPLNQSNGLFMPPPPQPTSQQQIMPPTQPLHNSQSYGQFPAAPMQSAQLSMSQSVNNIMGQDQQQQFNSYNNYNNGTSNDNGYYNNNNGQASSNQNGTSKWNFSWLAQNKLVNTFVEKAKIGVESFVNTVDPQMSNYNHPANRPLYLLSSTSTPKVVNTIREAFNNCGFSKISINSIDAQNSSQFAPQIIGYPCALQSCREKLENSLTIMQDAECTVVAVQDFIAEITTDCWFELAVIMLKDKKKNIELTVYTEALPVGNEEMSQLEQYTPKDYPLKWSGLSCRLPEKNFNFNACQNGSSPFLSYDTADTMISNERLSHALRVLATLFKNRMLAQM